MLSLVHLLEWRAAVNPQAIALTDQQGAELSYAALAAAAERSAAGFAAAGIVHAVVVPALASTAPGAGSAIDGPAALDPAELVSWTRERLAGFKCPTGVTVVSELPRNATGKVLRAALREPFWTGRDRLVS